MNHIHEGEQAVQARAGEGGPGWGSPMFDGEVSTGFADFLRTVHLVAVGGPDESGALWCSLITGEAGFVDTVNSRTIELHALPSPVDPMRRVIADDWTPVGMLALSPETLRRVKVNGTARRDGERIVLRTEQVLGNCPKYLQCRRVVEIAKPAAQRATTAAELSPHQTAWIERADTFFIASLAPGHGADANHRGGAPGFVKVVAPNLIVWPDYTGNSFYMTLGNLELNSRAGVVFPDWTTGDSLQATGTARVNWERPEADAFPGALRTIEFSVDTTCEISASSRLHWQLLGYSRFNPDAAPTMLPPTA